MNSLNLSYCSEIFKYIVKPLYIKINRLNLFISGVKFGNYCNIYNRLHLLVKKTAKVSIGNNFTFSSGSNFNQLSRNIRGVIYVDNNAVLKIGDNVGISSSCIWSTESIYIGNNVKIGADSLILDTDAHSLDYIERKTDDKRKSVPICIEDDVFIGTRTIILKGVTIGARSIIGAGSVVTKSIPADCIAAGNPCKVIKYINNETNANE